MNKRKERKSKKHQHFWRACSYLWPYWRYMAGSIAAAFFVGLAMTGGLGAMLPVLRVLINGDTVQAWIYRQVAESRLGVKLSQDPIIVQLVGFESKSPAKASGLTVG